MVDTVEFIWMKEGFFGCFFVSSSFCTLGKCIVTSRLFFSRSRRPDSFSSVSSPSLHNAIVHHSNHFSYLLALHTLK